MLVGAAVCPPAPVLVPELAPGAPAEVLRVRSSVLDAVRRIVDAGPSRIVAVGAADEPGEWGSEAIGTTQPFGPDLRFGGGLLGVDERRDAKPVLPAALTVAAYLVERVGWAGPVSYVAVTDDAEPEALAAYGEALAAAPADEGPAALLVMGDGSAKRSVEAPGYLDRRAAGFDRAALAALVEVQPEGLLRIDRALAHQLWVGGTPAWQLLAGALSAVQQSGVAVHTAARYDAAPLGVGYFVVDFVVARSG